MEKIKAWTIIFKNTGLPARIGDADCVLSDSADEETEAMAIFENKWGAKEWLKRQPESEGELARCEIIVKQI